MDTLVEVHPCRTAKLRALCSALVLDVDCTGCRAGGDCHTADEQSPPSLSWSGTLSMSSSNDTLDTLALFPKSSSPRSVSRGFSPPREICQNDPLSKPTEVVGRDCNESDKHRTLWKDDSDIRRRLTSNLTSLLRSRGSSVPDLATITPTTAAQPDKLSFRSHSFSSLSLSTDCCSLVCHSSSRKKGIDTSHSVHLSTWCMTLGAPPRPCGRSHRVNSDFLRLIAFETEMKRRGIFADISDFDDLMDTQSANFSSWCKKVKMFLDPRRDDRRSGSDRIFNRSRAGLYS